MNVKAALAAFALAGCNDAAPVGSATAPKSASSIAPPPSSAPRSPAPSSAVPRTGPRETKIVVTKDGLSKTLSYAVAKVIDPSLVELRVGASEPSCEKTYAGPEVLTVWLSNVLSPDGSRKWTPGVAFYPHGGTGPSKLTLHSMDPMREVAGELSLDITFKEEQGGFRAQGSFDARSCGASDAGAPGPSPGPASLSVAGVAFPLRGARIRTSPSAHPLLELSSSPCECGADPCRGEVTFHATLDGDLLVDAALEGSAIGSGARKQGLVTTAKVTGLESATAKTDLDWDFSIPTLGDETKAYRFSLKGPLSLKVCKDTF